MKCDVADCGGDACIPSRGFQQPATQAEFTLQRDYNDFYDIETINGMSIPHEMRPTNVSSTNLTADPYFCGNPGGAFSMTSEPACSWKINPPSVHFNYVKAGGASCTDSSSCSGD